MKAFAGIVESGSLAVSPEIIGFNGIMLRHLKPDEVVGAATVQFFFG